MAESEKKSSKSLITQREMSPKREMSRIINGYKIGKRLGKGGYASVYFAYDTVKKRNTAIKIINKNDSISIYKRYQNKGNKDDEEILEIVTQIFKDEVNTLINLSMINESEYIIKYYDNFENEHNWYIVMEYVSGTTLGDYIQNNRHSLKKQVVWTLMLQLILGLQHIHNKGYSHNDLGSNNIMLTDDFKIKYIDFGISCVKDCVSCHNECSTLAFEFHNEPVKKYIKEYQKHKDVYLEQAQNEDIFILESNFENLLYGMDHLTPDELDGASRKKIKEYMDQFQLSNFDDGRTSDFLYMIGGKEYNINTILTIILL